MFAPGKTKGVSSAVNYIEDVFSTYLYTSTGTTQTITNNIDFTKGGMVWAKRRDSSGNNVVGDTVRGAYSAVFTNLTNGADGSSYIGNYTSTGFDVVNSNSWLVNNGTYTSWSFRKQPKFFDVVTYTGNGATQNIAHSLGSVPGCILFKRTDNTAGWIVYHTSLGNANFVQLNTTGASLASSTVFNSTTPTSSVFSVGNAAEVNTSGGTYVAYLFANNAGGFGLTGTDNVISCGTFTTDGSGAATVNLGYEPQYLMWKASSTTGNWAVFDTMRGWNQSASDAFLAPNLSSAESTSQYGTPNATGFVAQAAASVTYIYIAIRRGPMKVPTDATKVFSPIASSAGTGTKLTTNFPVDTQLWNYRGGTSFNSAFYDRLRSVSTNATESGNLLTTSNTNAESTTNPYTLAWDNTGFQVSSGVGSLSVIYWNFRRAPGFFDEVCYTGTGVARTVTHNLGVTPELMIIKSRSTAGYNWPTYIASLGATKFANLNISAAPTSNTNRWNDTAPTASVFTVGDGIETNNSGTTFVAYLFATCAGVSKVGSYTGNGSTQTINCGFAGGARFVLIKRTDSTGDWYVYDTARGMTTLTDPYLLLNSAAAETATLGSVTTVTTGFAVNASILAAINTNAASYIFLAIA